MSNLRTASVSDTTPLQRLESQSSSEPSSPILHLNNAATSIGIVTPTFDVHVNHKISTVNSNLETFVKTSNKCTDKRIDEKSFQMEYQHGMRNICSRISMDFLILALVGFPILAFHLWGVAYKRGFFCDDVSLKHHYKKSTISSIILYIMGFMMPMIIITAVEFFISNNNRINAVNIFPGERYYISRFEIPDWIVACYKRIGILVFGSCVGQLTTDIAKYSIGRLRPHFFAVCQPIMPDGSTCDDTINMGSYIEKFECRGLNATPRMLKEIRLSFPSGHATFAFYSMVYMMIYLQNRITWERYKMFKHLVQFLFFLFAWYTALTRISDYQHHVTDVMAGSVIGTIYAIVLAISMR